MPNTTRYADGVVRFLASKRLAIWLFLLLCIFLIPKTLTGTTEITAGWLPRILLSCMAINLLFCTALRIRTLAAPVLLMHAGTLVILAGGLIGSFGFVATVNVFEGTSVDTVYRWDLQEDAPLGFNLAVRQIRREYYPIPVRVGVLRGADHIGLYELKTGESFTVSPYTIRADAFDVGNDDLTLSVFAQGRRLGSLDTSGERAALPGFPYDLKLVAYRNPVLKRTWVDLAIIKGSAVVAEGATEVNSPFCWNGMCFYHIKTERDVYENPYVGIQITRDPGKPVVYAGFLILLGGTLLWMRTKLHAGRRPGRNGFRSGTRADAGS